MSSEPITTFKNLYEETKEFNNKQDFLNYYETHKKEIDEMKTRGLNVKFRINGYHIGRKEGRLILFPEQREKNNDSLESMKLDSLAANMKILNDKIDNLTNSFNQFLSLLQHNQ